MPSEQVGLDIFERSELTWTSGVRLLPDDLSARFDQQSLVRFDELSNAGQATGEITNLKAKVKLNLHALGAF
ncbi:unnamed protein product [Phytophthora lilii]|uniref:Unnamed protein product n=1 Tax=Phytophthora lilii TaxID=2077276 RepID=A0A9W6UA70_9STRA|nr:unnamed protein product [Phytophthora lilii]